MKLFGPPVPLRSRLIMMGCGSSGAGASFVGPLDDYVANMEAAWSVGRRLLSSYTGSLIRVRESGGSTEADIGFDADGNLDEAALLAHCGANSGFITKVYAQTGSKDLVQATAGRQPRIVNAGTIDRFNAGARPCAKTTTVGTMGMETATFTALTGTDYTLATVFKVATSNIGRRIAIGGCKSTLGDDGTGGTGGLYLGASGPTTFEGGNRAVIAATVPYSLALGWTITAGAHILRTTATSNTSSFTTGAKEIQAWLLLTNPQATPGNSENAEFVESVIWTANRDIDMSTVLAEMNTFYGL